MFDKRGAQYTGIGSHDTEDEIWFGAVSGTTYGWVDSKKQIWNFNGTIKQGGNTVIDSYSITSQTVAKSIETSFDNTMSVKAGWNNEVNFGGTFNASTIYFSYRAIDSKPIPDQFVFGGSTGTSYVAAKGFKVPSGASVQFLKADGSVDSNSYFKEGDAVKFNIGAYNVNSLYDVSVSSIAGGSNLPTGTRYGDLFCMPYRSGSGNTQPDFATQIFLPNGDAATYPNSMWFRTSLANSWNTWQRVIAMDTSSKIVDMGKVTIRTEASNNYVTFTTSNQDMTIDIGSATAIYGKKFQATSDIRKKDIIDNIDLNVGVIAQAPIFDFVWKAYPDTRPSIGTSAQYWEKVLPYSVSKDQDGYLAMDYGATALVAAVLTARKVSEHEQRIAELERENKVLWNMIATLKAS